MCFDHYAKALAKRQSSIEGGRHASHNASDGEPSDIDAEDERLLIEDTAKAVKELDQAGIYTYCINLDPDADEYVQDTFGNQCTVIDNVESLPEKPPQLFMGY